MRRMFLVVVVAVVFLSGVLVFAQDSSFQSAGATQVSKAAVPRLVRFSSVLKDAAGKATHGVEDVTFSLYAIESGGEPLWFETQTVEADALGRYTVLLGAMHADGLPMDLFSSGEARWLGVSVGKLPEQARVLLVSVPYALKAGDAETVGGKPATAFVASEQLKDQVRSELSSQVSSGKLGGRTLNALIGTTTPSPQALGEGQSSFACGTTTPCVTVSQTSTGSGIQAAAKTLGLYGVATQTTGTTYGVRGQTPSTTGRGVLGYATATSGGTLGVYGLVPSTSGVGLYGEATATTGATRGLVARAASTTGIGAWGYAFATSGATTGVRGDVWSPNGIAGIFNTVNPSGKILSGRVNGVEKFSVDGSGNLAAGGGVTAGDGVSGFRTSGVGVHGSSSTYWGVAGESGYGGVYGGGTTYGVMGASSDTGVYGEGLYVGVSGHSQDYTGVVGSSSNGDGVDGYGYYTGVFGWSMDYTGVWGSSANGNGVYGEGYGQGQGIVGYSSGSAGVYGYGYDGVHGYGESGSGLYGESPYYGVYGYSDPAGGGIAVYAEGNFAATGTKSAVVPLPDNRVVSLYAVESPENWFEDFGSGQLQNGEAEITLDPTFAETVNTESKYHVFLTPNGDSQGLYIARKSPAGFEVREQRGGKSDIAFDYRIVARRRGYETVRLRQVEADTEVVKKLRESMAAASSAKSPKLVLHKEMERPKRPEPPKRAARPARPALMRTPQLPNASGQAQAPQGLNLGAPSN